MLLLCFMGVYAFAAITNRKDVENSKTIELENGSYKQQTLLGKFH